MAATDVVMNYIHSRRHDCAAPHRTAQPKTSQLTDAVGEICTFEKHGDDENGDRNDDADDDGYGAGDSNDDNENNVNVDFDVIKSRGDAESISTFST